MRENRQYQTNTLETNSSQLTLYLRLKTNSFETIHFRRFIWDYVHFRPRHFRQHSF